MESLPYIDEHSRRIDASSAAVWSALLGLLQHMKGGAPLARILGCDPARATAAFEGRPGDAVPGFRVAESEDGHRLELRGRHRFSRYTLTFLVEGGELRAATHAVFPGILGRLYRAAVIGTGAHRIATRRMLRQVARAASATPARA